MNKDSSIDLYVKDKILEILGNFSLSENKEIYYDLGIYGDEFGKLLEIIHKDYNVDYSKMDTTKYVPGEGCNPISDIMVVLGFKPFKSITIADIKKSINSEFWLDSNESLNCKKHFHNRKESSGVYDIFQISCEITKSYLFLSFLIMFFVLFVFQEKYQLLIHFLLGFLLLTILYFYPRKNYNFIPYITRLRWSYASFIFIFGLFMIKDIFLFIVPLFILIILITIYTSKVQQ